MFKKTTIAIVSILITVCFGQEPFKKYTSKKLYDTNKSIENPYLGPLFMVGCADSDINKMIREEKAVCVGKVNKNEIILFGDDEHPEDIYKFKEISYYEVTEYDDTFFVIYIEAIKNSEKYDLIIELKQNQDYHRTLSIIKDGKLKTVFLWVEAMTLNFNKIKEI